MTYAVVACPGCRQAWAVDLQNANATCPSCRAKVELAAIRPLWQGDLPQEAQTVAASYRLAQGPGAAQAVQWLAARPARTLPRHDSPLDAAAASGAQVRNLSQRAEAVALTLTRLMGLVPHGDLLLALEKAGLVPERAEAEVIRLLATDVMVEPKAGFYRCLGN